MFNTINQSSTVQTTHQLNFSSEELKEKLRKQLEYYFSKENLINDIYLQSQMDAENYVPISLIANFKLIKYLTDDLQLIIDVLKESSLIEIDKEEKKIRSSDNQTYHLNTRKRCIILLRNVPFDAKENEILDLFINKYCSVLAIGCERVLESDHSDCWYVTFNNEDDAQNAFLYLTRENISIRGQKILARIKTSRGPKSSIPSISQNSSIQTPVYTQPFPTNHPIPQQYYNTNLSPLSFPMNMNFQQQVPFINRNHPVFPTQVWYIPSPTADSYSPMFVPLNSIIRTYNGMNPSKTRITSFKPRNSTKSITNNGLLNSSQNNTS